MSDRIEITKDFLTAACDYIPLKEKEAWTQINAPKCFDKLAITADDEAMPPMYSVNTGLKSRYLMGAFVKYYLQTEYEAEASDEALMTEAEYDRWAGSHVWNQIERWKRDFDVRDKCFDIITDYKDLEKRFGAQLISLLNVQNDAVIRQSEMMTASMKDLPQLLEQLKEMQGKAETDE